MFAERLDFIMQMTNTSNSSLARAISFDPSYISKIRSGKRKLPRNDAFFDRAVPFFARNLNGEYQIKAVSDAILDGRALPEDRSELEKLLSFWLRGEAPDRENGIHHFLKDASGLTRDRLVGSDTEMPAELPEPNQPPAASSLVFYGNEGKRNGVELFLTRLCKTERPHTLLLYSDEDMSWLYEDAAFAARWSALLKKILSLGGRIKMIHTLGRNATELMAAVQSWLPLYLTGQIEPCYCPRLRDGVYHRSLFVAQGCMALVSTSVTNRTDGMPNLLFEDREIVDAFETEFWNYYALCRPLMRVYRGTEDAEALRGELRRLDGEAGGLYMAQALPSFATMPKRVLSAMLGGDNTVMEALRERAADAFRRRLESGEQVVELLNLPDPAAPGHPELPVWQLLGLPGLVYDAELLSAHLAAVQAVAERYDTYRVLISREIPPELMLLASENAGTLLLCPLPAVFSMEEQTVSAALREYLQRAAGKTDQKNDAELLTKYIRTLRREI